jgi:hypothetical protein
MVGISGDILVWITHFIFIVSRTHPKINLRKVIMKNGYAEARGIVVSRKRLWFSNGIEFPHCTVFIDLEMREEVINLFVIHVHFLLIPFTLFYFFFLSEGRFFVVNLTQKEEIPTIV